MSARKCMVCGKEYTYCPTCESDKLKPYWMVSFHDENCREIWNTLCAVSCKTVSEEEGVKKLRAANLADMNKFSPVVARQIKQLLGEDKPAKFQSKED